MGATTRSFHLLQLSQLHQTSRRRNSPRRRGARLTGRAADLPRGRPDDTGLGVALAAGQLGGTPVDNCVSRCAGREYLGNTARLKDWNVVVGDDAATEDHDVGRV